MNRKNSFINSITKKLTVGHGLFSQPQRCSLMSPLSMCSWVWQRHLHRLTQNPNQRLLVSHCHLISLTLSPHKHPLHQSQLNPFDYLSPLLCSIDRCLSITSHISLHSSFYHSLHCTHLTPHTHFYFSSNLHLFAFPSCPLFTVFASTKDSTTNTPILLRYVYLLCSSQPYQLLSVTL